MAVVKPPHQPKPGSARLSKARPFVVMRSKKVGVAILQTSPNQVQDMYSHTFLRRGKDGPDWDGMTDVRPVGDYLECWGVPQRATKYRTIEEAFAVSILHEDSVVVRYTREHGWSRIPQEELDKASRGQQG